MPIDLITLIKALGSDSNRQIWRRISLFLPARAKAYLVGGYIRDVALSKNVRPLPEHTDLDFIVVGLDAVDLTMSYKGPIQRKTTFGGVEVKIEGRDVDIWTAELQIKVAGGCARTGASLEEALEHFTLTTNAVAFDFESNRLVEKGFLLSFDMRQIDLGQCSNWILPWAPYHLAHLARARVQTRFSVSSKIIMQIQKIASPEVINKAIDYLQRRKQDSEAAMFLEHWSINKFDSAWIPN